MCSKKIKYQAHSDFILNFILRRSRACKHTGSNTLFARIEYYAV